MVCGQTPADCLNCGRAVCVWDKPESLKSRTWWTPETYRAVGDVLRSERTRLQYNQREMAQHLGGDLYHLSRLGARVLLSATVQLASLSAAYPSAGHLRTGQAPTTAQPA